MLAKTETADQSQAFEVVLDFIEGGGFAPGDRLPSERELMVSLGLSRTALRKALDKLDHEGRIWRHVGKGTFIASQGGATRPGRLAELSRKVTPFEMMRARLTFEPAITREAAINASGEAVARIVAARDRAVAAPDWETYEASDDAFHRVMAEATNNLLVLELFDQLNQIRRAVAWDTVVRKTERPARDHPSFAEHDRIVEAIAARNPGAAYEAMWAHLSSVSARLFAKV